LLGDGAFRIIADTPAKLSGDMPSLEECQAMVDRRLHLHVRLSDSYFFDTTR
jgi:hypothetical protein